MTTTTLSPLPRLQRGGDVVAWANALVNALELQIRQMNVAGGAAVWQTSSVTPTRTLNASTATLATVANALGTLIQDQQSFGSIASQL